MNSPHEPAPHPDITNLPLLREATSASPAARRLAGSMNNTRKHTHTPPAATPTRPSTPTGAVDWALVAALSEEVAKRLHDAQIGLTNGTFSDDDKERGRSIIRDVTRTRIRRSLTTGDGTIIDTTQELDLNRAVFNRVFRLGRWSALIDEPGITDIEITGHDQVFVVKPDGTRQTRPPVADTDQELHDDIAHLASVRGRPFSAEGSNWHLELYLEDEGVRLSALSTRVAHRPTIRMRLDPANRPTLEQCATELNMLDWNLALFLRAAIRARLSIAISGEQGSGKTTLARALAMEIPPWESVATIETERELFLHHCRPPGTPPPISLEGHPGGTEMDPFRPGRRSGQIDLSDMIPPLLRGNLDRILAGECRGPELMAMFQAMQQGAGGLTTLHAKSSRDAIGRMVLMAEMSQVVNAQQAEELVGNHIQLIVHVAKMRDYETGKITRYVKEVLQIQPGPDSVTRFNTQEIFWPTMDSARPLPRVQPAEALMIELVRAGYPRERFAAHYEEASR